MIKLVGPALKFMNTVVLVWSGRYICLSWFLYVTSRFIYLHNPSCYVEVRQDVVSGESDLYKYKKLLTKAHQIVDDISKVKSCLKMRMVIFFQENTLYYLIKSFDKAVTCIENQIQNYKKK